MNISFKTWLENKTFKGLTNDAIIWWANYAKNKLFATPEEARDWIFNARERADKEPAAALFGVDGSDFNRAFAQAMPIYQSGKSWKIGKRIRTDNRLRLNQIKVKTPDMEYLHRTATSNTSLDWDYGGIKWLKISDLVGEGTDDYYYRQQMPYLRQLAEKIKQNKWIEAVVVGMVDGVPELWEGQHRVRAMRLLGFSTVPCYIINLEK